MKYTFVERRWSRNKYTFLFLSSIIFYTQYKKIPYKGYLPPTEILNGNLLVEDIAFDINYENPLLVITKNVLGNDEGSAEGIVEDPVNKDTNFILKRDHATTTAERLLFYWMFCTALPYVFFGYTKGNVSPFFFLLAVRVTSFGCYYGIDSTSYVCL